MNEKKHEPLLHISKRGAMAWQQSLAIRLGAIALALVICGVLASLVTGVNPVNVYATMWQGAFGSVRKSWITCQSAAILLIISLALTPAFRMQFWNIGGEGQVLVGALATAAVMITQAGKMSAPLMILVMIAAALAAGAVWGLIPALFKAIWNTNETLSTLMMNYIATQLVAYFVIVWEVPKGSGKIGIINQDTSIGWLPQVFGSKYALAVVVALICTVSMFIYLNYTKHGYEISVVGESRHTARYVGIKVEKVIIRTMILSGALCGLAGLLLVGGINHTLSTNIADGQGFTAVMVSWLAKFNPFIMIPASLLIVFMNRGAADLATNLGLNQSFSDILTGIILFFIIGCEFFIRYKINMRSKAGKEAAK